MTHRHPSRLVSGEHGRGSGEHGRGSGEHGRGSGEYGRGSGEYGRGILGGGVGIAAAYDASECRLRSDEEGEIARDDPR